MIDVDFQGGEGEGPEEKLHDLSELGSVSAAQVVVMMVLDVRVCMHAASRLQ
jgi:hypothetical protein